MSRSKWKGYYTPIKLNILKKKLPIKFWVKNLVISKKFLNKKVSVYNGRDFKYLYLTPEHVGFKLGQFIFTRKFTKNLKYVKK
jgi:small subunit ribosomal protein S19